MEENKLLTRRTFVGAAGVATAGLALFGLPGCGSDSSTGSSSGSSSSEPVYGGTLRVAVNRTISAQALDPLYIDSTTADQVCQNYGDTIIQETADQSEYLPNIATDWTISDDGLVYTFTIRDDVYFQPGEFQDGRLLTAEDVAYSLTRAKDYWCNYLYFLDTVEATDEHTVVCTLTEANATFLHELVHSSTIMVPREEVEGWGDEFGMHPISTGPFKVVEHTPDSVTRLEKNENYWAQEPYLDGLEYYVIGEDSQAINGIMTGELDVTLNLSGQLILQAEQSDIVVAQAPEPRVAYMGFNLSDPILSQQEVRDAIAMAVNREEIITGVYSNGDGEISYLPVPTMSWGYDTALESLAPAYDPDGALALLQEAGYSEGDITLTLSVGTTDAYIRAATLIQEQLSAVGINVEIRSGLSSAELTDLYLNNGVQMWINGQGGSADPATFVGYFLDSEKMHTNYNAFCYSDPDTDALIDEALALTDQDERKEIYDELIRIAMETNIGVFYATTNLSWGFSPKVHGYVQENKAVMRVCGGANLDINIWKEA